MVNVEKWSFGTHGNTLQTFVRIIKEHPQLDLVKAEIITDLFSQELRGEICSDEYNGCVSLVGVTEGIYKKSWKPGVTTEFRLDKFNRMPFKYNVDIASRTFVIDDHPDYTEIHLYLYTSELLIRLTVRFLHQIFDEVMQWFAVLPVELTPSNRRNHQSFLPVQEAFDRMVLIFEKARLYEKD